MHWFTHCLYLSISSLSSALVLTGWYLCLSPWEARPLAYLTFICPMSSTRYLKISLSLWAGLITSLRKATLFGVIWCVFLGEVCVGDVVLASFQPSREDGVVGVWRPVVDLQDEAGGVLPLLPDGMEGMDLLLLELHAGLLLDHPQHHLQLTLLLLPPLQRVYLLLEHGLLAIEVGAADNQVPPHASLADLVTLTGQLLALLLHLLLVLLLVHLLPFLLHAEVVHLVDQQGADLYQPVDHAGQGLVGVLIHLEAGLKSLSSPSASSCLLGVAPGPLGDISYSTCILEGDLLRRWVVNSSFSGLFKFVDQSTKSFQILNQYAC